MTLQPNLSASLSGGDDIQASDCCPASLALLLLLRKTWRNDGATGLLSASLLMWCSYYYYCSFLHVPFLPFCRSNLLVSCSSPLHLAGLEVGPCREFPNTSLLSLAKVYGTVSKQRIKEPSIKFIVLNSIEESVKNRKRNNKGKCYCKQGKGFFLFLQVAEPLPPISQIISKGYTCSAWLFSLIIWYFYIEAE